MFRGRKKHLTVKFEECDYEPTDAEFYYEFNKYNASSLWICLMFMATCFVQFSLEIDDTIFDIASNREESCIHNGLSVLSWKPNETATIFYPTLRPPCMMYDYNLTEIRYLRYEDAKKLLSGRKLPPLVHCSVPLSANNFSWSSHFIGTCKGALYRKRVRGSKLLGMAIGSLVFGTTADLYGRKVALYFSIILYYAGMIIQQLMFNFTAVKLLTIVKGMGKGGLDHVVFVLFLEYCNKNNRAILVMYVKALSPLGTIIGIHMKKHLFGFSPELRYIIAIPSLFFILYAWYVPESPRWCLSYCCKQHAWDLLYSLGTRRHDTRILPNLKLNKWRVLKENLSTIFGLWKIIKTIVLSTYLLFFLLTVEYTKKQYVTLKGLLRPYAHQALLTMAKLFSFMYVLPPLIILRRRLALLWFFLLISVQLGANLFMEVTAYYILNILMMLCIYSVRNLFLLYMCEVFPTSIRATAIGFIMCLAYLFYYGHYLYELEIHVTSLHIQNVALFVGALVGMIVVSFLSEVKHEELPDYKRYRREYEQKRAEREEKAQEQSQKNAQQQAQEQAREHAQEQAQKRALEEEEEES